MYPGPESRPSTGEPDAIPHAFDATAISQPPATVDDSSSGLAVSRKRRRRTPLIVAATVLVVGAAIALLWYLGTSILVHSEEELFQEASKFYKSKSFGNAAKAFDELADKFKDSPKAEEYRFLARFSDARKPVYELGGSARDKHPPFEDFVNKYSSDPLLKAYRSDVGETFDKLAGDLSAEAIESIPASLDQAEELLALAEKALGGAVKHLPTAPSSDARVQEARRGIARALVVRATLNWLKGLQPTAENLVAARQRLRQEGLLDDPEARKLLDELRDAVFKAVKYTEAEHQLPRSPSGSTDHELYLIVAPATAPPNEDGQIFFAVSQGVLYALDRKDGKLVWATRVGIDTGNLPVTLPGDATAPEISLVLSSDNNTLTARRTSNGQEIWHHQLRHACLARPVLLNRRAYVPTYDGRISEIDILSGRLLGWYDIGLPLSVGGTHQEGTSLVYFPADKLNVYVLDVAKRKCLGILESGHPSGSLRSEPLVISWAQLAANVGGAMALPASFLVLNQTDGFGFMKERVFQLPIAGMADPAPLQEVRVRGWSWFYPHYDGEKIALATDAGVFDLFGINQFRNQDSPLFPLLPDGRGLVNGRRLPPVAEAHSAGRAQVVHAEGNDFWVLLQGMLQHWQVGIDAKQGIQLSRASSWKEVSLGSPLHAAQADLNSQTLFVVTRSLTQHVSLATVVAAETGAVRWQKQLGLLAQGDPLAIGREVLVADQGAGWFAFDAGSLSPTPDPNWRAGGRQLGKPLEDVVRGPFQLVSGGSVYEIVCVLKKTVMGQYYDLVVRKYTPGQNVTEQSYRLGDNYLAGTPGLAGGTLWLPLDNGNLYRQHLVAPRGNYGPSWRAQGTDDRAAGHVVPLGGDRFVTTDGNRSLTLWQWPAANQAPRDEQRLQLDDRIVSAPVVFSLPGNAGLHLALADSRGIVQVFHAGDLKPIRSWNLNLAATETVTAGPFVRGSQLGCVVGQHRLVWLDPMKDDPLWKYESKEKIVGEPQVVADLVLVADLSGRFVGLEPSSGLPRSPGYQLRANVVPAAAPVAFAAGQAFAPLSDGTVFLLSLNSLGK
jgi:outer membrane protein assembly factor BamB